VSLYDPDTKTLYPAQYEDGWWLCDKIGPLDGPYASRRDVEAAIYNDAEYQKEQGEKNAP
jgi:hypothetical protein